LNTLLHICCAPCAIFPVNELKKEGCRLAGFFYNPNIHPYSEYIRRRDAVEKLAVDKGVSILISDYDVEKYFQFTAYNEAAENRCPVCWWLRLERTALFARDNGFDAFTTTLLGSPYQDHEVVRKICEDAGKKTGIKFYYKDFRSGFKSGHEEARASGIYRQNYCGCIFSEHEGIVKRSNERSGEPREKSLI